MRLWDGEKITGFLNPPPNVIGYFHPHCAKKYFADKEQPSENDNIRIKEKLLRNLDKISIEQCGYLINAELVKRTEKMIRHQNSGQRHWKSLSNVKD